MASFTWLVDSNPTVSKKPRVNNIKFGDGYEQRIAYGINTNLESWDLSFANRDETESGEIDSFLTSLGGVDSFDWTPPGQSTPKKFKCQEWSMTVGKGNLYSINAKFEQVAEP